MATDQCRRSTVDPYLHSLPTFQGTHTHTVTSVGQFRLPDARFDHVHIDLVGPLPSAQGFTHLLTCVDCFTRWPEAISIPNTRTETVVQAFLSGWIFRFGVPRTCTSDCGGQFKSHLWQHLMQLLGTHRTRTTAYHPCANGLVECFHRQLKAALMARQGTHWLEALPLVLLGIRSSLKEDLHCTSAELVYGCTLHLLGDYFIAPSASAAVSADLRSYVGRLKDFMHQFQPTPTRHHSNRSIRIPTDLAVCTHVFIWHNTIK